MGQALKDRLVVANDTKQLIIVRDFVSRMLKQAAFPGEDMNKLILAVDEAVTNIIEHGFAPGAEGVIEIEVECANGRFQVVIRDNGRVFNPESLPELDMKKHLQAGKKKGLGIFLMRQIMDEVRYRFQDGVRNELTLVKLAK